MDEQALEIERLKGSFLAAARLLPPSLYTTRQADIRVHLMMNSMTCCHVLSSLTLNPLPLMTLSFTALLAERDAYILELEAKLAELQAQLNDALYGHTGLLGCLVACLHVQGCSTHWSRLLLCLCRARLQALEGEAADNARALRYDNGDST